MRLRRNLKGPEFIPLVTDSFEDRIKLGSRGHRMLTGTLPRSQHLRSHVALLQLFGRATVGRKTSESSAEAPAPFSNRLIPHLIPLNVSLGARNVELIDLDGDLGSCDGITCCAFLHK